MMGGHDRDQRAWGTFLAARMRRDELKEVDIDSLPEPSGKERAALELLGPSFIDELVAGQRHSSEEVSGDGDCDELALAGEALGSELHRAKDVDDETAAELERKDQEIIDRKRREREEQG